MTQPEQILHKILPQIAIEQNFCNYDLKVEPITSGGANYSTTLYNVTISEGNNLVYMFAKVATAGQQMRSQAPKVYETEILAYTKLAKVYERLQDEHKVPKEHRLVFSKFYGCNPTEYEETIVLEDLVMDGYQAYDRFKSIEYVYAKSAVSELAKMHALAFAYSEYHSEEYNEIIDYVTKGYWVETAGESLISYLDSVITKAIGSTREETKDEMKRFFNTFDKTTFANFYKTSGPHIVGHGDFRPSNLMHKIRDNGTIDIKIVDLQTLHGGSPVVDLLHFIFTGSDEEFRAQYYEDLLDHYYNELAAAMKRLHLDPERVYSRKTFENELKEKLTFGLIIAIFSLPTLTVDTENAPKVNEELNFDSFNVEKTSDLYAERLNGVINDFVKWGILK